MLISIVVPIYNSEEYLKECIDSIINQTYKNIEIIMINDGSTDNSKDICNNYAKKDKRIIVINQANLGVSEARNVGIKKAKGEYILFVDSDDIINERFVEILSSDCNNNCLNICKREVFRNKIEKKIITKYEKCILRKEEFIKLYDMGLMNSPCGKLYNKSIILDNCIMYNSKISLGEDLLFNLEYFKHIDIAEIIDLTMYYYRVNENITLSKKYNKDFDNITAMIFDEIEENFCKYSNKQELYRCLYLILIENIQNNFKNKSQGLIKCIKNAHKTVSSPMFKERLFKCKNYISNVEYFILNKNWILIYKIFLKLKHYDNI